MPNFICTTCGTQYPESSAPPTGCKICLDDRQYVGHNGQQWTTLPQLRKTHLQTLRQKEPNLIGISSEPKFGIGQRALLIRTPAGNILWDCISLLDPSLINLLTALGGLSAIAISHPHYYTTMVEWSRAFDCPIYLHSADREWIMRPDDAVEFWEGETKSLGEGLTLIRCGGHFPGGTVLHWGEGCEGRGALLSGDIIQVVQDRTRVSFMYSYPNFIPLPASQVQRIVAAVEPYEFDRIYGAFWGWIVQQNAKQVVRDSANRYIQALRDE